MLKLLAFRHFSVVCAIVGLPLICQSQNVTCGPDVANGIDWECPGQCLPILNAQVAEFSGANAICGQYSSVKCSVQFAFDYQYFYAGTTYNIARYTWTTTGGGTTTTDETCDEYQGPVGTSPTPSPTPPAPTPTPPPVTTKNQCQVHAHSSVNTDSLALTETIPLVGVPFSLAYSSDRFRDGLTFSPKVLGLGGWAPSIVHHYDSVNTLDYTGNGDIRFIPAMAANGRLYTTDSAGTEIYYFDSAGIHTATKDALTGATKFTFTYDSQGRISSIADTFLNVTTFAYGTNATLTSPYGQKTSITFDTNGYLASVTNPNNEIYSVAINSSGFLQSFTKPAGQTTTVTYSNGLVVSKDLGAGGDFFKFTQANNSSGAQIVTSTSALDRMISYQTGSTGPTNSTHTVTSSFGGVGTYTNNDVGSNTSTDLYGDVSSYTTANDPRFGALAPFTQSSTYTVPQSPIAISTSTSVQTNPTTLTDPFNFSTLTTRTVLQNDPTRTFLSNYTNANRTTIQTSPLGRTTTSTLNAQGLLQSFQTGNLSSNTLNYDSRGRLSVFSQGPNRNIKMTYDSFGRLATSADFLGHVTSFQYDNAGRVIRQTQPDGSVLKFTYDLNGNLTSLTPPTHSPHFFTYNLFELVAQYLPPALSGLNTATNYTYNLDQQLTSVALPTGQTVSFNYASSSGLLNSIVVPNGQYSYAYDTNSDLISSLSSPDGEILNYQYAGNIPTSIASQGPVISNLDFTYNSDGTLASVKPIDT